LEQAGASIHTKVASPVAPGGRFTKDAFTIDLQTGTVTCPAQVTISLRQTQHQRHAAVAKFGTACTGCPLAAQCTSSPTGRTITISRHEAQLTRARTAQADPDWKADYKATRPKVERKIGHLMRRRHGGRRARVRRCTKVAADFPLLAAAVNLAAPACSAYARARPNLGHHDDRAGQPHRSPSPTPTNRPPEQRHSQSAITTTHTINNIEQDQTRQRRISRDSQDYQAT
jgi:hypothetical protein